MCALSLLLAAGEFYRGEPIAAYAWPLLAQAGNLAEYASAAMTLDVYSRLFEDDLDGVAEPLDAGARVYSMCTDAPILPRTAESAGR